MLTHGHLKNTKSEVAHGLAKTIVQPRKSVAKSGLGKWFDEEWTDIKTGKACGRSGKKDSKRAYPACRPKKVAKKMTAAEKKTMAKKKTSSARKKWNVTSSGKRRKA